VSAERVKLRIRCTPGVSGRKHHLNDSPVAAGRDQYVDDLSMLVGRAVAVAPEAVDLDAGVSTL
jgi:hypothetical protein